MAAPFELKIHDEFIAPYKEQTLEVETQLFRPSAKVAATQPLMLQARLEYAHGLTPSSEVSANLFTSRYDDQTHYNGYKFAYMFIPEHDESGLFHYGVKTEVDRVLNPFGPADTFVEITPILAIQLELWRITFNPSIDKYLNGQRQTRLAPATRVMYDLGAARSVGVEYFSDPGPWRHPDPTSQRNDYGFVVWDVAGEHNTYSVGVGKGLHAVGEPWIVKLVGNFPLNR